LILSNEIELAKNSRFPYVFTIRLANSELKSKDLSISNCIELFELYTKEISNTIAWLDFEKITDSVFSEYGICKEIEKLKLPSPEIKILFKNLGERKILYTELITLSHSIPLPSIKFKNSSNEN
jgi:hypothetical protein